MNIHAMTREQLIEAVKNDRFYKEASELKAENERLRQELEKHNLEQQAKAVENLYKWFAETHTNANDRGYRYKAFVSDLRNQAKEQSK